MHERTRARAHARTRMHTQTINTTGDFSAILVVYIILYCIVLHCLVLSCLVLSCITLHCIALHCIALHCIALYCIVLYYIALYCIIYVRLLLVSPTNTTVAWRSTECAAGRTTVATRRTTRVRALGLGATRPIPGFLGSIVTSRCALVGAHTRTHARTHANLRPFTDKNKVSQEHKHIQCI